MGRGTELFDYLKRDVEVSASETKLVHTSLAISEDLRKYRMQLSRDRKRNDLRASTKDTSEGGADN